MRQKVRHKQNILFGVLNFLFAFLVILSGCSRKPQETLTLAEIAAQLAEPDAIARLDLPERFRSGLVRAFSGFSHMLETEQPQGGRKSGRAPTGKRGREGWGHAGRHASVARQKPSDPLKAAPDGFGPLRALAHAGAAFDAQGVFNKGLSAGDLNGLDRAGAHATVAILAVGGYGINNALAAAIAGLACVYAHISPLINQGPLQFLLRPYPGCSVR